VGEDQSHDAAPPFPHPSSTHQTPSSTSTKRKAPSSPSNNDEHDCTPRRRTDTHAVKQEMTSDIAASSSNTLQEEVNELRAKVVDLEALLEARYNSVLEAVRDVLDAIEGI